MNARQAIDTLTAQGIRLVVEGDRLRYHPKENINVDQIELLKTHKQQIIRLLSRPEPTDQAACAAIRPPAGEGSRPSMGCRRPRPPGYWVLLKSASRRFPPLGHT